MADDATVRRAGRLAPASGTPIDKCMFERPPGDAVDPIDLDRLIRAVADDRDRAAFALLFHYYAPKLKSFLVRGALSDGMAEDIVQDVMLTVWQQAPRYDPKRAGLSTWIFTIARNRRIDLQRRERRPLMADDPVMDDLAPSTDGLVETREWNTSLVNALDLLPADQAEVVRLAYFDDKPQSAIARERRLPLGTVKTRVRLALRHLRWLMEKQR
ncbi:sigma-70 family RNA polymerase sigma factor [Marinivivus vitaminiproducens]|uniref:sigma-70 family RNA polymerase sigma factor n=1 Tax=Marinivivus vitaminiproducens TaxID=3035935 RepID=UPI0027A27E53|nr:sigma-70 family RNA polymerase sigma factor [Geminicoccaceae bacterium SCSIO 64248]